MAQEAPRRGARGAGARREPGAGAGARARGPRARLRQAGAAGREDVALEVERPPRFVSRGGEKLANALDALGRDSAAETASISAPPPGLHRLPPAARRRAGRSRSTSATGSSTRGFGPIHRVVVLERVNARHLASSLRPELITCDVSFISATRSCRRRSPSQRRAGTRSFSSSRSSRQASRRAEGRRTGSRGASPRPARVLRVGGGLGRDVWPAS